MDLDDAVNLILDELIKAEDKHPDWSAYDVIHRASFLAEECGEAVRAANNYKWENGLIEDLKKELAHAGATAIRNLMNLEE